MKMRSTREARQFHHTVQRGENYAHKEGGGRKFCRELQQRKTCQRIA